MSPTGRNKAAFARAWIGLGGNVGDVRASMCAALEWLDMRQEIRVTRISGLYRTAPWGKTDQPPFLNACASLETSLPPEELLDVCLAAERRLGRIRGKRWGPRTLDIDILAIEGRSIASARVSLPHPRMTDRAFVLAPLADIAPDLVVNGKAVSDWLTVLPADGIEKIAAPGAWWRPGDRPTQSA